VEKPVAGEVVVLRFPQTNLQAGKRRPALVVADLTGDDLILCQITTQTRSDATPFRWSRGPIVEAVRALSERLHPNPPPFAEVLTGGGDRSLPKAPRDQVPSFANISVSGGGSGWRPLLSVRIGMHTGPVVIADGGEPFGVNSALVAR